VVANVFDNLGGALVDYEVVEHCRRRPCTCESSGKERRYERGNPREPGQASRRPLDDRIDAPRFSREGERFLILRSRNDHPDLPDAISIVGDTRAVTAEDVAADRSEELHLHYFDSRGVHRVYDVSIKPEGWEWALEEPGWAQRLPHSFADGDRTMRCTSRLSVDNGPWNDDLEVTYRRR
jgi:hypothetical protein